MLKQSSRARRLILIAGMILVIGADCASSQEPPPSQSKWPAESHQNAKDRDSKPAPAVPVLNQDTPPHEESGASRSAGKQQDTNKAIARYTFWLMCFTGFLALGTIGLFVVTLLTANAAKLSADALVSAERAHLFVRITLQNVQLTMRNAVRVDLPPEWGDGTVPRIHVSYVIKNFGKTPAVLRQINHALVPLVDLPSTPSYSEPKKGLPDNRVLAENGETPPIDCACEQHLTLDEARDIAAGNSSMWLIGRVVYEDVVTNTERVEPFLYRYAGNGFDADYRPAYNQRS